MFKRIILAAFLVLASALPAQTHTATLTWTASTDAAANPTLSYNVYRVLGLCTQSPISLTKIGTVGPGVTTFTDTTGSLGDVCYGVTAALNGTESSMLFGQGSTGIAPPQGPLVVK